MGVDEICYRHPHKYLTVIGDHDTKTVVPIEPGRSTESPAAFYEQHKSPTSTRSSRYRWTDRRPIASPPRNTCRTPESASTPSMSCSG
nr:transposase [Rhodococcus jostii]